MKVVFAFSVTQLFKAVEVIPQLSAPQQTSISHIIEVTESRRLIDTVLIEFSSDLTMSHRGGRLPQ